MRSGSSGSQGHVEELRPIFLDCCVVADVFCLGYRNCIEAGICNFESVKGNILWDKQPQKMYVLFCRSLVNVN